MLKNKSDFLLKYPSFTESNVGSNIFSGNLNIKGVPFYIQLSLPEFPSMKNFKYNIFKGIKTVELNENFENHDWNIEDLLKNIENRLLCLENITKKSESLTQNINNFLKQLKCFESKKFRVFVNESYNCIKFANFDEYGDHFFELSVGKDFHLKVLSHSLPDCCGTNSIGLFRSCYNIDDYLSQFYRLLNQLEDFYSNMNTIDVLCFVVEPTEIDSKCNWRIFKLNDKVFIKIIIDPFCTSAVTVYLIGPTNEVLPYRQLYSERIKHWDADMDIHRNLLRIFDLMSFPMRKQITDGVDEKPCNICFTYLLDSRIPLISCENSRCDTIFHVVCLKKWFATLRDGKTFLSVTQGSCPFCKEKLSASFAQLLDW